jgi:hypothetical protein
MKQFVEAEGEVHLVSPIMGGEYTLCGDAFDLASDVPGYGWKKAQSRTVTCKNCVEIINACRGVRVA